MSPNDAITDDDLDAAIEASAEELDAKQVINPITGAVVDLGDIDSIIRACDENKRLSADLRSFDQMVREAALAFTEGNAKTRRLRGRELQAKVEMPDVTWDQTVLKEAWNAYPKLRDEFLRIDSVGVKARESKKLKSLKSDDPAFDQFQKMLLTAEREPTGTPRVSLEDKKQ